MDKTEQAVSIEITSSQQKQDSKTVLTTNHSESDSDLTDYELRPTVYNLFPLIYHNKEIWEKLSRENRLTLIFWIIITPLMQIVLAYMVLAGTSENIGRAGIDPFFDNDWPDKPVYPENDVDTNFFRHYKVSWGDIFALAIISLAFIYAKNETCKIVLEYNALRRKFGIALDIESRRPLKKNCCCNMLEFNLCKRDYLITFALKVILEMSIFVALSVSVIRDTGHQMQEEYFSGNEHRYTDGILNILGYVFIFELDDWIYEHILSNDLKAMNNLWKDEYLVIKIDKNKDNINSKARKIVSS